LYGWLSVALCQVDQAALLLLLLLVVVVVGWQV